MPERKPWLSAEEQVEHLKSKGTRFNFMTEAEATDYLRKNNNYFRLRSYRTGFSRVEEGQRRGQYANLDFKMLVDLSIIDMLIRYEMLVLTLDIEHFQKVSLLNLIEDAGEDGYGIVADFIAPYDRADPSGNILNRVKSEIDQGKTSPYIAGLIEKYPEFDFPAWAFAEVVSFGSFSYFYKFCADRFGDKRMQDTFYILQSVKSLRNACAHNNCIINDMSSSGTPKHRVRYSVSEAVSGIEGIGRSQRRARLSNERLQQIASTLYGHSAVASPGVKAHRAVGLNALAERMNKHPEYYDGNCQILSGFDFLTRIIEAWFPVRKE